MDGPNKNASPSAAPPSPSLVYSYGDGLYLNLTSRCPTACAFCMKFTWDYKYRGHDLKLPADPSEADLLVAADHDVAEVAGADSAAALGEPQRVEPRAAGEVDQTLAGQSVDEQRQ